MSSVETPLANNMELVIREFTNSPYDSFVEYYKQLELTWFAREAKYDVFPINFARCIFSSMGGWCDSATFEYHRYFLKDYSEDQTTVFGSWDIANTLFALYVSNCNGADGLISAFDQVPRHNIRSAFDEFKDAVLSEILTDSRIYNIVKFKSSYATTRKRIYLLDRDGGEMEGLLVEYVELMRFVRKERIPKMKTERVPKNQYIPLDFTNKWLQKFGVADELIIKEVEDGIGVVLYLVKEGDKRLLTNEGFGAFNIVIQLIHIEVEVMKSIVEVNTKNTEEYLDLKHNDFAAAQNIAGRKYFAVEEPEAFLHPKMQSILSEMYFDAYKVFGMKFIIETHSEYMVRKTQSLLANKKIAINDFSVNYIDKPSNGGTATVRRIEVGDDGCFTTPFGEGFFDEADNLAMDLLTAKI